MSRGLTTRLKRLEKQHRPRRVPPLIVFAVQADEAPGPIIGLASLRDRCPRLFGEDDWSAFAARARAALGGVRIATAVYAAPMHASAPSEAPRPVLPDTNPKPFPWHLAGIGQTDERYLGWHPSNAGMIGG